LGQLTLTLSLKKSTSPGGHFQQKADSAEPVSDRRHGDAGGHYRQSYSYKFHSRQTTNSSHLNTFLKLDFLEPTLKTEEAFSAMGIDSK